MAGFVGNREALAIPGVVLVEHGVRAEGAGDENGVNVRGSVIG